MIPMLQQGQFGRSIYAVVDAGGAEYIPTITYALVGSDSSTSSTSYSTLLSTTIDVAATTDFVNILMSASGDVVSAGNTPSYQINVDGVDVGQVASTQGNAGGFSSASRIVTVTGLSIGTHTVTLAWKSFNGNPVRIRPVTTSGVDHAALVCRLSTATTYSARSSSATSTSTTVTDSLISGVTHSSVGASSALLIRFSACGLNNSTVTAKFRILVDGVAQCGTADAGDGSSFYFNASMVCVVPVSAGSHSIDVEWAGGAGSGSTIDPGSDPRFHAAVWIDEVYVGSPRFERLTSDVGGVSNTTVAQVNYTAPVSGTSDVLIEGTFNIDHGGISTVQGEVKLNGTAVAGSRSGTLTNAGSSGAFITHVATLAPGASTIDLVAVGGGGLNPVTNPSYQHASLVVWPVIVQ
jgi:hypothetical protein